MLWFVKAVGKAAIAAFNTFERHLAYDIWLHRHVSEMERRKVFGVHHKDGNFRNNIKKNLELIRLK